MAKKTVSDTLHEMLGQLVREASATSAATSRRRPRRERHGGGKGLFAGAGLAAATPMLKKALDAPQDGSLDEQFADLRERAEAAPPASPPVLPTPTTRPASFVVEADGSTPARSRG